MSTFTYHIDELPLVLTNDGIEAAYVNGEATIHYGADGLWHTEAVTIDGYGPIVDGKRTWPQVPAPHAIAQIIIERLEGEWESRVQEAVREQVEEDRICAADDYADMKRDQCMEDRR